MSHPVTVDLSEAAFSALQLRAQAMAKSPSEVATAALEQEFGNHQKRNFTDEERRAARERFIRHFGEVNLGHPSGADNESIDADLAREYEENHEGG